PAAQRMWTHTMTLRYRRNPGIALAILLSRRQFDRFTVLLHEITPKLISNFWGSLHEGVRHRATCLPRTVQLAAAYRGCSTSVSLRSLSTFSRLKAMGIYLPVAQPSSRSR